MFSGLLDNYFLTNPISRASSPTMAKCSAAAAYQSTNSYRAAHLKDGLSPEEDQQRDVFSYSRAPGSQRLGSTQAASVSSLSTREND